MKIWIELNNKRISVGVVPIFNFVKLSGKMGMNDLWILWNILNYFFLINLRS